MRWAGEEREPTWCPVLAAAPIDGFPQLTLTQELRMLAFATGVEPLRHGESPSVANLAQGMRRPLAFRQRVWFRLQKAKQGFHLVASQFLFRPSRESIRIRLHPPHDPGEA
jgi:hypothetical protein